MGSTLMRDSCGPQSLQPRRCARHDVSRFYPGAQHAKRWYMPETQRQGASRLGSLFVFSFVVTDKEGHNTVKLVRQRSPKQHPKGCWGLLGLEESRQFFLEEPWYVEKAHIDQGEDPTSSKHSLWPKEECECRAYLAEFTKIGLRSSDGRVGNTKILTKWGFCMGHPLKTPHTTIHTAFVHCSQEEE